MGPIWATRIWANPYGIHVEPGCTPYMGPIWACLLGNFPLESVCHFSSNWTFNRLSCHILRVEVQTIADYKNQMQSEIKKISRGQSLL